MTFPAAASEEIKKLRGRGIGIDSLEAGGQSYARVRGVIAASPPWDRKGYEILVAIPAAYDDGAALDAFYLRMPYSFKGGTHPRVANGPMIALDGHQWQLVSWHYADGQPWDRARGDGLETHIVHCSGFFAHRGAINAY